MKSVTLYFTDGSSDKTYSAQVEKSGSGYVVNFQFGRRGGTLNAGTKTSSPVSLDEAEKIFDKLVQSKMDKGYTQNVSGVPYAAPTGKEVAATGFTQAPKAPAVTDKGEREFSPQLLNSITEDEVEFYLTNDDYMAQEKKNGNRVSVKGNGKELHAFNKLGKERPLPTQVATDLKKLNAQVDGELVGDIYWLFDILSVKGKDIRSQRADTRIDEFVGPPYYGSKNVRVVETAFSTKEKRALFARLKKNNAEGIVFKLRSAPYTSGRPTKGGTQFKFKFYKTASVIVTNVNKQRSVAIAVLDGKKLVDVGNVTIPVNREIPPVDACVEVKYLYAYKGGSLYQPQYLDDRSDELERKECVIEQLSYKGE